MRNKLLSLILALIFAISFCIPAGATVLPGFTSKVDYDNTDPSRYRIVIDLTNQILSVYEKDSSGGYTKLVKEGLCTTGDKKTPTSSGTYKLGDLKERFGYFVAFGQYAQYWTQVVRGIYIHSVMYNSRSTSSMSKAAYRDLGTAVSHGCVRVLPDLAQWIFYNCPPGTTCQITSSIAANPKKVAELKKSIPAYSKYVQPRDSKPDPIIIPGRILYNNVPVRTGFSSKDTTIQTLKKGDKVDILQLGSDWMKVKTSSGKLGYIKTPYVLCYPDSPVETVTAHVASSKTYVYASMNTNGKKLATIPKGSTVTVLSNPKQSWYYGVFNGVEGYLRTKYVKATASYVYPELDSTAPGQDQNGGQVPSSAKTKSGGPVNLRSAASSTSSVVAVLKANTPVTILGTNGSWYEVEALGYKGYLHSSGISFSN